MGTNAYLNKQLEVKQHFLDVGQELGMQKMWDYVQLALRDPEVMGKDILGRKRIEKIYAKLDELASTYAIAFTADAEADYYQEQLDGGLREVWGDDLTTFYGRYPQLKQIKYDKPQKGWK
jgi:hypothetical protein